MSRGCSPLLGPRAVGDELQVLVEVLPRPRHAEELDEAVGGVVGEPVGLHERDDAVRVGGEGLCTGWGRSRRCRRGRRSARLVEAVAAHRAADGVGDQPLDVLFPVGPVEGDLVVGDFGESSS